MRVLELVGTEAVRLVREAASGTPFEGRVFLVGGCVRDAVLGRGVDSDLDMVSDLPVAGLVEVLRRSGVVAGEAQLYPRFGTAMVTVAGRKVELVTARRESYAPESRKPQVSPASLGEDAARRDFTVNALMADIWSGEVVDLLGTGLADLEAGVLRTPLDPVATFADDPLRMLRAVRFRHRLGFSYAEGLAEAVLSESHRLSIVSMERIRDEVSLMLAEDSADAAFEDMLGLGLLGVFAPELVAMVGVEQGDWHDKDVWGHTMSVLRNVRGADLTTKLACLLHDVGKPVTRVVDGGGSTRYLGHEVVGAEIAEGLMRRLRFGSDEAAVVSKLVRNHMRLTSMVEVSDSAARRILRDMGDDLERWLCLVEADSRALREGVARLDVGAVRERLREVSERSPVEQLESPLSGWEIMEATGSGPGPEVGRSMEALREAVLNGTIPAGDKGPAYELLKEMGKNRTAGASVNENNDGPEDTD